MLIKANNPTLHLELHDNNDNVRLRLVDTEDSNEAEQPYAEKGEKEKYVIERGPMK